jgi:ABC-type multidrug transport system fused ATPase/permease subunit
MRLPGTKLGATGAAMRPFIAGHWKALAGAGMCSLFVALAELAKPWPIALVIDELFAGHEGAFSLEASDLRLLAGIAVLVVAIAAVDAISTYFSDLWLQRAGERIVHDLRTAAYAHLQRLSLGFHQRRQKGDLVTRVTADVNAVGSMFSDSLGPMVQAVMLLVGIVIVSIVVDPVLALVSFAATPVLAVLSFRYRGQLRTAARAQRSHEGVIASTAGEALSAMGVVKAFGSEGFEHRRVERLSETRMDLGMQLARLQARFDGAVSVVTAIGTALVVVVGVFRVSSGALSPGDLVVFATYARKLNSPLKDIARESGKTSKALARADEIAELLAADEILEERPGAYRGPRARGAIEVNDVTFSHTEDRSALHGVSLRIEPGSRVALVGPSGAGKSTLAALIARFYDPASGRVLIDGRDLRDCRLAWLRDQIGVLLQDTVLFTGTVAENIAYGSSATEGEIVAAANAAAAHAFVSELPGGYETQLGPQGVGLSGGQRQRIGIARTLLRNPPVLVLDEPTTGLDAEAQAHVLDGLRELMRERTTILITHQTELWETADQVLEIERGRIVRKWSPDGHAAPAEALTARQSEEPALSARR